MVMNNWFSIGDRENEGNDMPGCLALQVFRVSVRQPAAFMEMDRAEGATMAAAVFAPKTPNVGELEIALTDYSFVKGICKLSFCT